MKKIIILIAVGISFMACNTKNQIQDKDFTPWISYVENGESTEVRLNLPNGGSKVISKFEEHIFQSGKNLPYEHDISFEVEGLLNGDKSYKLVNTSYAKTSWGNKNLIYIYKKNEEVAVFIITSSSEDVGVSKLIFKGNVFQTNSDALPKLEDSESTNYENKKICMKFSSDNNYNEKIELVIDGKDVFMEFYENEELVRMVRGSLGKKGLLLDEDYVTYVLSDNNLCYHEEGLDYCYSKIDVKSIR